MIFLAFFLNNAFSDLTTPVHALRWKDARILGIEYTHEIYQGDQDLWKITIVNYECSHKLFFLKFYEDEATL